MCFVLFLPYNSFAYTLCSGDTFFSCFLFSFVLFKTFSYLIIILLTDIYFVRGDRNDVDLDIDGKGSGVI